MDIKLKKRAKEYFRNIYSFDVIALATAVGFLLSIFSDYISINRYHGELEPLTEYKNILRISILSVIAICFIIKIAIILIKSKKGSRIKSIILRNIIFIIKNGFNYKETRKTLLVSITLALILLITYLYFLATGGYENNIFVKFFTVYPFKGSVLMITILFLSSIYGLKKTLDILVVNDSLKRVSEGNLQEDINLTGSPIIKDLINNINLIRDRYKDALDEGVRNEKLKTELISNVSHDLKTPLTSIINYVNILKNQDITDEERGDYLLILEKKSLKLKSLIEDLFEMSKINSGKIKLHKEKLDILSLIHQGVGEYSTLYEEKNISFKVTTDEDELCMELDGRLMSRAIENLIINALKYSLDNTRVYIDIDRLEDNVRISIKNVANYEMSFNKEHVFERFVRGDDSRNSKVEGSGLGLAITKSIIDLHGGNIKIDIEGDMFKIYIILPIE